MKAPKCRNVSKCDNVVISSFCEEINQGWKNSNQSWKNSNQIGKIPTKLEKFQPVSNQCPTEIELELELELNLDIKTEVEAENRELSSKSS